MAEGDAQKPVLLITGASSGIGAATARAAASTHRLVLAARREEPLQDLVAELGGEEQAIARRMRRHRVGPGRGGGRCGARGVRPHRRRLRQCRLRRHSRIPRGVGRALALDGADERLRRGADDPRRPPPPARAGRWPYAGHQLRRRAPRRSRVALLGDEVGGDGDRRGAAGGAAPDARQRRDQGDADRAGDDRHPVLRQPPRRVGAPRRRHRPRRDVRPRAAARTSTSTRS